MDPFAELVNYVVLQYILPVFAVVLLTILGDCLLKVRAYTRAKLTAQVNDFIDDIVHRGVLAAEQLFGSGNGQRKKAAALDYIQSVINEAGIKNVSVATLDNWLEKAVQLEFPKHPELVELTAPLQLPPVTS